MKQTHWFWGGIMWLDFFICFFFGFLGVHKFREGKIGMGLLYLFTLGLFGFGWLFDSIRYFIRALRVTMGVASNEYVHRTGYVTTCPTCGGRGQILTVQRTEHSEVQMFTPCPNCGGSGEVTAY